MTIPTHINLKLGLKNSPKISSLLTNERCAYFNPDETLRVGFIMF